MTAARRLAARVLVILGCGALPALEPWTAAAQTVEGIVLGLGAGEQGRDAPIGGARIRLFGDGAEPIDSTLTDADGRFRLPLPRPGAFTIVIHVDGYLTVSEPVDAPTGAVTRRRVVMPLVSTSAAETMRHAIRSERDFQLPLDELCGEPLRPWEAGVLVGVTRERATREPLPAVHVEIRPEGGEPRIRVSTASGTFWFCNVPAGAVRIIGRVEGLPPDTFRAVVRAGAISWYDALMGGHR